LTAAAVRMANEVRYDNLGTFEFLVNVASDKNDEATFAFIEANPRLQVEHTVTEEVIGIDLVKLQLQLAAGRTLAELHALQAEIPKPRGFAIQMRINMESMAADGSAKPSGGTLTAFDAPSGPGVRTDSFAYAGYTTSPNFDSLLAKVIAHSGSADFADAVAKAYRALCEFRIEGVSTNVGFLQSLLRHPEFAASRIYTRFVEDHIAELVDIQTSTHQRLFFDDQVGKRQMDTGNLSTTNAGAKRAGARIDARDPLAVLHHGKTAGDAGAEPSATATDIATPRRHDVEAPEGTTAIVAPMQGTIVSIDVREGDRVHRGQQLFVMEAMKMEHVIEAPHAGVVTDVHVQVGEQVPSGAQLLTLGTVAR